MAEPGEGVEVFVAPLVVLYLGVASLLCLLGALLITVGVLRVRNRKSDGTMVSLGAYALIPGVLMVGVPWVTSLWR